MKFTVIRGVLFVEHFSSPMVGQNELIVLLLPRIFYTLVYFLFLGWIQPH